MTLFEPAVTFLPISLKDLVTEITANEKGADTFCRMYPSPELFQRQTLASMERHFTLLQAKRLYASIKMGRFIATRDKSSPDQIRITNSVSYCEHVSWYIGDPDREYTIFTFLNRNNDVISTEIGGSGGMYYCTVDAKLVFKRALELQSSSIMMAHNHPSGGLTPSQADIGLCRQLCAGAKLLDMKLLDFMIVSSRGYYSFADQGLLS